MNVKASVDDTMIREIWQRLDCDYMSDMKIAGNFRYGFCVFFFNLVNFFFFLFIG